MSQRTKAFAPGLAIRRLRFHRRHRRPPRPRRSSRIGFWIEADVEIAKAAANGATLPTNAAQTMPSNTAYSTFEVQARDVLRKPATIGLPPMPTMVSF